MPYNAGTAYLQVIPSFRDIEKNIAQDLRKMARGFGAELEKQLPKALTDALAKASKDVEKDTTKAAADIASARASAITKLLDQVEDDQTRRVARSVKKQGDIYDAFAKARQRRAEQELKDFDRRQSDYVKLFDEAERRNTKAVADANAEQNRIAEQGARERAATALKIAAARQKALSKLATDALKRQERQEEDAAKRAIKAAEELAKARARARQEAERAFAGTTAGRAQASARAGAEAIQDLPVHLNESTIYGEMQRIRQRIKQLGNLEIGVNIDVDDFASGIQAQFARLRAIAHDMSVDIDVRTDAAAAATELGGILVLLNRIDGSDAKVDVNVEVDSARARMVAFGQSLEVNFSRLGNLIALGAALGSAIVPAAAAATAAIGAIGTAALGAGAGIGVMLLGFGGVGEAVKALSAASDDQAKTNKALIQSENQVASAIDGVASARRALANTIANNRDAAIRANQSVAKAERDLARTRKEVARDEEEAARKVGEARRKAAQDAVEAAQRVQDAQRALARDERDVKRAREDLTQAYKDAQRALEDLSSQMKHNSIDQQQALLDIAEAKEELDRMLANPRATEAEREQARINYERRKLELEDLGDTQRQLAEDYDKYTEDGLEGSEEVMDAQERLRRSEEELSKSRRDLVEAQKAQQQALVDGTRAIADAVRNQQESQERGQQAIADAEERLSNERRERDAQQRQAAFALAGAQQGLVSAQRSLAGAYAAAGDAGGAALDKVNTAMGKLSPTAQRFAKFIFGLRDDFYELRSAASEGLLSGLQTAITSLLPYLPPLTNFVRKVGFKLGELFVRWADALKDPVFVKFFDYLDSTAIGSLEDLFKISLNLLEGFIGLFLGFTPFSEDVTGGVLGMSEAFREWATTLDTNKGFQSFLSYIRENGPLVIDFFAGLIKFGAKLIEAMAPLGPVVLKILDGFVNFLSSLPEGVLVALVAGIAGLAAGLGILSAATSIAAISTTAFVVAGVIAAVAAAVVGITTLFTKFAPLRDFFVRMWHAVVAGFMELWTQVQPILASLGQTFLVLWHGAVVPAFHGIMAVAQAMWGFLRPIFEVIGVVIFLLAKHVLWLWKNIWAPAFAGMATVITKVIVPVVRWLWENIVRPIFKNIEIAANIMAALFKVSIGVMQIAMKALGKLFDTIWKYTIKPFWDLFASFIKWLGPLIDKHVRPHWDAAIKRLAGYWEWLKDQTRKPIKFIVETLLNEGILKGYNKLADMFDVEPKNVKIPPPKGGWATGGVIDGGVLPGYTPGRDVHTFVSQDGTRIGLSGGEGILRPEVTSAVKPWLDAANAAARKGGKTAVGKFLGGFARGGVVPGGGDGIGDWFSKAKGKAGDLWKGLKDKASDVFQGFKDIATDPAGFLKKLSEKLIKLVPGRDTQFVKAALGLPRKFLTSLTDKVKDLFLGGNDEGGAGTPGGGSLGGSAGMMRILRKQFPGLPLISGFRPGAITATGNPSYHGKNRAVDLPPRMDVFNWLLKNYRNSREIIFSPAGGRQIWNGRPHVFSGITKAMHYNHVHWAYDKGGFLPDTRQMPGQQMSVFHGRRQPDAVLTNEQWASISKVARDRVTAGVGGRGDTYNFDFEKSQLDPDRLNAIQVRRDTIDRVTRPNW